MSASIEDSTAQHKNTTLNVLAKLSLWDLYWGTCSQDSDQHTSTHGLMMPQHWADTPQEHAGAAAPHGLQLQRAEPRHELLFLRQPNACIVSFELGLAMQHDL